MREGTKIDLSRLRWYQTLTFLRTCTLLIVQLRIDESWRSSRTSRPNITIKKSVCTSVCASEVNWTCDLVRSVIVIHGISRSCCSDTRLSHFRSIRSIESLSVTIKIDESGFLLKIPGSFPLIISPICRAVVLIT